MCSIFSSFQMTIYLITSLQSTKRHGKHGGSSGRAYGGVLRSIWIAETSGRGGYLCAPWDVGCASKGLVVYRGGVRLFSSFPVLLEEFKLPCLFWSHLIFLSRFMFFFCFFVFFWPNKLFGFIDNKN